MPDKERPAEAERAPASATPVSVPKDQNTPFDMYRLIDAWWTGSRDREGVR